MTPPKPRCLVVSLSASKAEIVVEGVKISNFVSLEVRSGDNELAMLISDTFFTTIPELRPCTYAMMISTNTRHANIVKILFDFIYWILSQFFGISDVEMEVSHGYNNKR